MNLYPQVSDSESETDSDSDSKSHPHLSESDSEKEQDSYLSATIQNSLNSIVTQSLQSSEIKIKTSIHSSHSPENFNDITAVDDSTPTVVHQPIQPPSSRKKRRRRPKAKKTQPSHRQLRAQILRAKDDNIDTLNIVKPRLNTETLKICQPVYTKRPKSKYSQTRGMTAEAIVPRTSL